MTVDTNAAAAAPVGTTAAPAAPAGGNPNPAPAGGAAPPNPAAGAQPPAGGQQPPAGGQQPPAADPAKPDAAGMKAYLAEKAKDVSLDGKSEADIAQLYADHKAKEGQTQGDFKIPDAYKDKPWAAKVKSMDDVFKQLDNLDQLAGKKSIVPDLKTATPEEREAFYAQTRPKDLNAYVIADEINGFPIAPETKEGVRKIFSENGISEVQGNAVIEAYNKLGDAMIKKQFDVEDLKATMKANFGDQGEAVIGKVRNTIKGMMTPEDQAMLDRMPNNYLGPVYRTLGNVIQRFGVKETDTAHFQGAGNAGGTAQDVVTQRAGIRAEIAKLGSQPHTTEEANALRQKLADTYKTDPRLRAG